MTVKFMRNGLAGVSLLAICPVASFSITASANELAYETVDEIVVTANRREESLQKTSLSITAFTGDTLLETGVSDYDSLVASVPGVIATGGSNFSKLTMRGIETSQTTSSVGAQRSVSIYFDDLPLTSFAVVTPDITPYDIERVEILRGPQGTLFGSGSLAGAVRFISKKPDATGFDARVDLDGGVQKGDAYRRRAAAMVNLPIISDRLAARVVGTYKKDDGYIDNVGTGVKNSNLIKDWGLRAMLRWTPSDAFSANLSGSINKSFNGDVPFFDPDRGFRKSFEDEPFAVDSKLSTANLGLDYDLGFANLVSSTSVASAPSDWNLYLEAIVPGVPLHLREEVNTKSLVQEIRLVSKASEKFDWVIGGYFLRQKTRQRDAQYLSQDFTDFIGLTGLPTNFAPGATFSNDIQIKKNVELAAFGEANIYVSDRLKLTGGVRITDSEFSALVTGEGETAPDFFSALIGALMGNPSDVTLTPQLRQKFSTGHKLSVSPKFVATFLPNANQTYYISASKGFRRGQPNGTVAGNNGRSLINPDDPAIVPESAAGDSIWNYELGAKLRMFDRRVQANFAAFYIDWSNMQIPLVRSSDTAPYVGNIGKSRSIGLEAELTAQLSGGLDLGVNFQIQNAKVTKITEEQSLISGALLHSPLASPKFKINAYARHIWALADGGELSARIDLQHIGSFANSFPNTPGTSTPSPTYNIIPSHEVVDASFGWSKGQLGATLYAENLLDSKAINFINPANYSYNRFGTLRPRVIGLRLSYRYQ